MYLSSPPCHLLLCFYYIYASPPTALPHSYIISANSLYLSLILLLREFRVGIVREYQGDANRSRGHQRRETTVRNAHSEAVKAHRGQIQHLGDEDKACGAINAKHTAGVT